MFWAKLEQARFFFIRNGTELLSTGSRCSYVNSERFKHTLSPDMLFDLEQLEEEENVLIRGK